MQLSELLNSLDCSTIHTVKQGLEDREFSGTTLLSGKMASTLEDAEVVFFSPASYFNMLPEQLRCDRAFFLYLNEPVKPLSGSSFVATIYEYDEWLHAFETVAQEFRLLQKHKEQVIGLTELINDDASLQKVLDVASEIMGAPASVMDNSYTFLAVSSNFPEFVAHGEEKTSKTLPSDAFALLKSKGLLNPNRDLGLVVFDWSDEAGNTYTNHFVPVKSGSDIVGSLSFLTKDGSRLRQSRANMLPALAQLISLQLQRSESFVLNKTLFYAHIFKVLQEGEAPRDAGKLAEQFSLFGYKLKRPLQVFYADLSRQYLPVAEVEPLAEQLKRQITNSVYTFTKTGIIFLASTDEPADAGATSADAAQHQGKRRRGSDVHGRAQGADGGMGQPRQRRHRHALPRAEEQRDQPDDDARGVVLEPGDVAEEGNLDEAEHHRHEDEQHVCRHLLRRDGLGRHVHGVFPLLSGRRKSIAPRASRGCSGARCVVPVCRAAAPAR